jgi:hypothetical protein
MKISKIVINLSIFLLLVITILLASYGFLYFVLDQVYSELFRNLSMIGF